MHQLLLAWPGSILLLAEPQQRISFLEASAVMDVGDVGDSTAVIIHSSNSLGSIRWPGTDLQFQLPSWIPDVHLRNCWQTPRAWMLEHPSRILPQFFWWMVQLGWVGYCSAFDWIQYSIQHRLTIIHPPSCSTSDAVEFILPDGVHPSPSVQFVKF